MNAKSPDQTPDARTQAGGAINSLGAQLRRAREERGITLREISDYTRISMRHLEAIESDDYQHLPGGLFNRSFIKAYARHVNFDERAALEAYARTAREHGVAPDDVVTSLTRSRIYMDGDTSRSPWLNIIISGLMLGILVLGGYAALHWYRRTGAPADNANASAPAAGPNPANTPTATQATPPPQPSAAPAGFSVQLKAKGEDVWLKPVVDDAAQSDFILKADQTREYTPLQQLRLQYSKSKADVLEVSINGQVAKAPPPNPDGLIEWAITKEGYRQFMP